MRSCIQEFDRSICVKANKQALMDLDTHFQEQYMKRRDMLNIVKEVQEQAVTRER